MNVVDWDWYAPLQQHKKPNEIRGIDADIGLLDI